MEVNLKLTPKQYSALLYALWVCEYTKSVKPLTREDLLATKKVIRKEFDDIRHVIKGYK